MKQSFSLKQTLKLWSGKSLTFLMPERASTISKEGMTIVTNKKWKKIDLLIRAHLLKEAEKKEDFETLARYQKDFWISQGKAFFETTQHRFEDTFIKDCAFIFEHLETELNQHANQDFHLIEIGTGNGRVLEYLSEKFPQIKNLTGIDLSKEQIEINKKKFSTNKKLNFISTDGFNWVMNNAKDCMIFVTSLGVLEYFTQNQLEHVFERISEFRLSFLVISEPKGINHDFNTNQNSEIYGPEHSFSHNYPTLLKKANLKIWHESYKKLESDDFLFCFIGAKSKL
ncbi:class I SAM-dependent methyltransferase [Euzebyella marina]|uniref:Class I SAM-dependent methyltransferase n=1 Tax=Euzebyella marina TaxID=1761453 RepID=A0A3G2L341_9FLAO|nr:class I SAM-dependent methyltransferase [Euzebyella marina]AYN66672.1 class I SAM-dependent methyltransferase [Euzebyella marina]